MEANKRRRRKPPAYSDYFVAPSSVEEQRLLQQAIENSKLDVQRPTVGAGGLSYLPEGPTFFPTVEEFSGNPLHYINKIRPVAEKYGICKIVPPKGWDPPFSVDVKSPKQFQTKEQLLHRIQEGISFGDGEDYCVSDYIAMAQEKLKDWADEHQAVDSNEDGSSSASKPLTPEYLEQCFWDTVEINNDEFVVEYGNDVDTMEFGSGFPRSERGRQVGATAADKAKVPKPADSVEPEFGTEEFYKESYWNLNNIPNCPESVLKHIKVGINGINVPWMYYGNLFSTFCWHNEDNYLYSINYHHWGAPKRWYGIPGTKKDAEGLEKVFKSYLSMKMLDVPDLLHHITTMFSPRLLQSAGVPCYKLLQHPGEFIITFPRAFHGGFSMGPNAGEAVNFATHDWIAHGADANERYRSFARPAVFSHDRLTFTMSNHSDEHMTYKNCKLLAIELERVVREEISQRKKLLEDGVRDVSDFITLPPNKLDQLDEESANYDDKRLCYSCKHICFLSCVACECSKSKVSCLRHSHFMCRCITSRRYLMVWCTEEEMEQTLDKVKKLAELLKEKSALSSDAKKEKVNSNKKQEKFSPIAPGVLEDAKHHSGFVIDVSASSPLLKMPVTGQKVLRQFKNTRGSNEADPPQDIPDLNDIDRKKPKLIDDDIIESELSLSHASGPIGAI